MGSERLPGDLSADAERVPGCQETRRSLLAKAGLVGGTLGLASLAGAERVLADHNLPNPLPQPDSGSFTVSDVTDWGAIGNDSHNDGPNIQQCITDSADKAAVYFPPGVYRAATPLKIPSNTTLLGVPGQSVIKVHPNLAQLKSLLESATLSGGTGNYAQSNVMFQGLTFDGNTAGRAATANTFLLRLFSMEKLKVIDCEFRSFNYGLVGIRGCRDVTLRGLRFRNWGHPSDTAAGPALTVSGILNPSTDETPSSRIRAYDLDFQDGEWTAIYLFARDFWFDGITVRDAKEGGIYTQGEGHVLPEAAEWRSTRDGVINNLVVKGVRRKDIQGCGFEGGGHNIAVRNFQISDTDGAGVQVNWPAENVTVEDGIVYDTVKQQASYSTFENYGQITLIQSAGFVNKDVTVRNVNVGKPPPPPPEPPPPIAAKYAIRVSSYDPDLQNPPDAQPWENLQIVSNDLRHGGNSLPAITFAGNPIVWGSDNLSRIEKNIGYNDLNQNGVIFTETGSTPPAPAAGSRARLYMKGDKLVVQFVQGSTTKYFTLSLTQSANGLPVDWIGTTTPP